MPQILFISGGKSVQQYVAETQHFAYWSHAFPALLEKAGWVDFETATPDVLENPKNLKSYSCIIVAWMPERFWKASYVKTLSTIKTTLFLEGPLPPSLFPLAGVTHEEKPGHKVASLSLKWLDDVQRHALGKKWGITSPLKISDIVPSTRPVNYNATSIAASSTTAQRIAQALLALTFSYVARHQKTGACYAHGQYDAIIRQLLTRICHLPGLEALAPQLKLTRKTSLWRSCKNIIIYLRHRKKRELTILLQQELTGGDINTDELLELFNAHKTAPASDFVLLLGLAIKHRLPNGKGLFSRTPPSRPLHASSNPCRPTHTVPLTTGL